MNPCRQKERRLGVFCPTGGVGRPVPPIYARVSRIVPPQTTCLRLVFQKTPFLFHIGGFSVVAEVSSRVYYMCTLEIPRQWPKVCPKTDVRTHPRMLLVQNVYVPYYSMLRRDWALLPLAPFAAIRDCLLPPDT